MNDTPETEESSELADKNPPADTPQSDVTPKVLVRPIILGDLTLASPTTETTVGAAGGASALPASPLGYVFIMIGSTAVKIPYYNT